MKNVTLLHHYPTQLPNHSLFVSGLFLLSLLTLNTSNECFRGIIHCRISFDYFKNSSSLYVQRYLLKSSDGHYFVTLVIKHSLDSQDQVAT